MKKGFTLVELLSVFALMGAILLLSIPAITGMLKQAEEGKINTFNENLFLSATSYISDNRDDYIELKETDKITYVGIENLLLKNYLNSNLINPKTSNQIKKDKDEMIILVKKDSEGIYRYELIYYSEYFSLEKYEEEKAKIINALNSIEILTNDSSSSKVTYAENLINLLSDSRDEEHENEIKTALLNRLNYSFK